jgi:mono/diheme cytochrome c family protein
MKQRVLQGERVPLSGGILFDLPIGKIYAKNLTPHESGIGSWSDEEIARVLRYGVTREGRALLDIMPFHNTSDEDLISIISYLRKQRPVNNVVPSNNFNFLGKAVNAFVIKPVGPIGEAAVSVSRDTTAAYGKYLAVSVANCRGCHTKRNLMTGAFVGDDFAGGLEFETPTDSGTLIVTTPNLTPDPSSKISGWTQEQFVARFRMGTLIKESHMPWGPFSQMSDDELKAIYNFLKTVKPVHTEKIETIRFER